jgi:CheY-like chemotaxis protein
MDRRPVVIAVSGLATEDAKRQARDAGFDGHVAKPVAMATLERLLDTIGARATYHRQLSR